MRERYFFHGSRGKKKKTKEKGKRSTDVVQGHKVHVILIDSKYTPSELEAKAEHEQTTRKKKKYLDSVFCFRTNLEDRIASKELIDFIRLRMLLRPVAEGLLVQFLGEKAVAGEGRAGEECERECGEHLGALDFARRCTLSFESVRVDTLPNLRLRSDPGLTPIKSPKTPSNFPANFSHSLGSLTQEKQ